MRTYEGMEIALKRLNSSQLKELNMADFRRLCYSFTIKKIVETEDLNKLNLKLEK